MKGNDKLVTVLNQLLALADTSDLYRPVKQVYGHVTGGNQ